MSPIPQFLVWASHAASTLQITVLRPAAGGVRDTQGRQVFAGTLAVGRWVCADCHSIALEMDFIIISKKACLSFVIFFYVSVFFLVQKQGKYTTYASIHFLDKSWNCLLLPSLLAKL